MAEIEMIRAYLDSSVDSKMNRFTLAGYFAKEDLWRQFDLKWKEVLGDPDSQYSYLHMCELGERGDPTLYSLINRCIIAAGAGDFEGGVLLGTYCSIEVSAMEEAKRRLSRLRHISIESVLVEYVCSAVLRFGSGGSEACSLPSVEFVFDRGERFAIELRRLVEGAGRSKQVKRIQSIVEGDMRGIPGLQAADYLAWHVNRWKSSKRSVAANLRAVLPTGGRGDFPSVEKLLDWYDPSKPDIFGVGFRAI